MYEIRSALTSDLAAMADIEDLAGFNHWTEKQLQQSIEKDIVWVAEQQHKLIAFAVLNQVIDESELLNIVVLPEEQGKGIANKHDDQAKIFKYKGISFTPFVNITANLGGDPNTKSMVN